MFNRILVCLDRSDLAEQIIPYATEQAEHFKSKVILLHIITDTDALMVPTTPTGDPLPSASQVSVKKVETETEDAQAYLSMIAQRMEEACLDVEKVAIFDPLPGPAIVEYTVANKIDLIAIATHGRSGLRRAVSGSVADHVLRETHLPVLLIRPTQQRIHSHER